MAKSRALSIRLKDDVRVKVEAIAEVENRSLSNVIDTTMRKALKLDDKESKQAARK